jgi:hypothetical protein
MEFVNLGHTGVKISRLCLGTMAYGTPNWQPWILDEAASRPFYREAVDAGINFFDTAGMYSLGHREEVLGRALKLRYYFFAIEHGRRRILRFDVTDHPTAEWVVQQLREAFPEAGPYRYAILRSRFDVQ